MHLKKKTTKIFQYLFNNSRQAYCNITAGAAFCLGLRFAGTQNEEATAILDQIFKLFLNSNTVYLTECAGKPTVESCLMLVLLATSLVPYILLFFPLFDSEKKIK